MECKYQLKDGCMRISMPKEVDHHYATQLRKEADLLIGAYHVRRLVGSNCVISAAAVTLAKPSLTDFASNSTRILFFILIFPCLFLIPSIVHCLRRYTDHLMQPGNNKDFLNPLA